MTYTDREIFSLAMSVGPAAFTGHLHYELYISTIDFPRQEIWFKEVIYVGESRFKATPKCSLNTDII